MKFMVKITNPSHCLEPYYDNQIRRYIFTVLDICKDKEIRYMSLSFNRRNSYPNNSLFLTAEERVKTISFTHLFYSNEVTIEYISSLDSIFKDKYSTFNDRTIQFLFDLMFYRNEPFSDNKYLISFPINVELKIDMGNELIVEIKDNDIHIRQKEDNDEIYDNI